MKHQRVAAVLLSAVLSLSTCIPMGCMPVFAGESSTVSETAQTAEEAPVSESTAQSAKSSTQETSGEKSSAASTSQDAPAEEETAEADGNSLEESAPETGAGQETPRTEEAGTADKESQTQETLTPEESVEESSPSAEEEGTSAETEEKETPAEAEEKGTPAEAENGETAAQAQEKGGAQNDSSAPDADPSGRSDMTPADPADAAGTADKSAEEAPSGQTPAAGQAETPSADSDPGNTQTVKTDAQKSSVTPSAADFSNAAEIKVGDSKTINIQNEDDCVYFRFTPDTTATYSFYSTSNGEIDPLIVLYDRQREELTYNDDKSGNSLEFNLRTELEAGNTYYLQACCSGSDTGKYTLHLKKCTLTLTSVSDPVSTVVKGNQITLEVKAESSSKVTYKWSDDQGVIPGASGAAYTFTPSESGEYSCTATDQAGDSMSCFFYVDVVTYSFERVGEETRIVKPGTPVTLSVKAKSESAITYQWFLEDFTPIDGATKSSYKYTPDEEELTQIICYVEDAEGHSEEIYFCIDSRIFDFSVEENPVFFKPGKSATLKVNARSDSSITYSWYDQEDNLLQTGASNTYTFTPEKTTQISCMIEDEKGRGSLVVIDVLVDTGTTASAVDETEYYVQRGDSQTLEVTASSDDSNATYSWINPTTKEEYPFDSSNPFKYTVENIQNNMTILFAITDSYGTSAEVAFYIYVEGIPAVYPCDGNLGDTSHTYYADYQETINLNVVYNPGDEDLYTCRWYDDDKDLLLAENSIYESYEFEMGRSPRNFRCHVFYSDEPENAIDLYYHVYSSTPFASDFAAAKTIRPGDIKDVSLTEEQIFEVFRFTPSETGVYTFYSSDSNEDPLIEIYDNSYDLIRFNDDGPKDFNFSLPYFFEAGSTWYAVVRQCIIGRADNYKLHLESGGLMEQLIYTEDLSVEYGKSDKIQVYGEMEELDIGELHFESMDSSIASVDADGKVTGKAAGETTIVLYADETDTFMASEEVWITVTVTPASIRGAAVSGIKNKTYNGKAQTQSPVVKMGSKTLKAGTDYTVSYSNNKKAGTASVTITGKGNYTGSVKKNFTINKAAQKLTAKAAASVIDAGKTTKVTGSGAKETGKYSFKSSNTAVATVSSKGIVTGKKPGKVTITVSTAATANYKAGKATVSITVDKVLKKPGNCHFVKWNDASYNSCRIAWNKVAGASGYQTLLSWTDGSHASYTFTKSNVLSRNCIVHPQHVSQMKVRAFYMKGNTRKYGAWSNVEYITPSPTKFTAQKKGSSSSPRMELSWNIIYGCNGYNVFVTTDPNGTWYWNQSTPTKATATSAVITRYRGQKLKKNTRYYVRIVTRRQRNGVFCTVPMPSKNTYIGSFKIK